MRMQNRTEPTALLLRASGQTRLPSVSVLVALAKTPSTRVVLLARESRNHQRISIRGFDRDREDEQPEERQGARSKSCPAPGFAFRGSGIGRLRRQLGNRIYKGMHCVVR
jgi:hypothetical protein